MELFDRLATRWGLVRGGVAPDHPEIKTVSRVYKTAALRSREPPLPPRNTPLGEELPVTDKLHARASLSLTALALQRRAYLGRRPGREPRL